MPYPTALTIFKELKRPASISRLADMLGLDHSTISTAVSSLVAEGLAEKQKTKRRQKSTCQTPKHTPCTLTRRYPQRIPATAGGKPIYQFLNGSPGCTDTAP